jgi:hypothetical protein
MINLSTLKWSYLAVCIILALIIISPSLSQFVKLPEGEAFSEFYILDSNHMADNYPFNMSIGQVSNVFLGVVNHMSDLEYYVIYLKFGNQSDLLPDSVTGTPSDLASIFEYRTFLQDDVSWEMQLSFAVENITFEENTTMVSSLVIDGHMVSVDRSTMWDSEAHGYYYQLFFELWRYDPAVATFQYHNRFLRLSLNMTQTA